ncbi:hypothetical protein L5515_006707 [Caenorhabditis briggsae]|uniref:Uncharacterized protein n=1 Tax=Caenorhabditis briggsae TaxID=6238 RepID=A0AAE9JJ42_CAEBR|nr:hypothetical protein L5515_006707 [Caenorhabditis briggsae]
MFFMTQPIPLLPIWAGHIHGPFWSIFHIGTHMASVIGSVIMGQQAAALTMCFVRKYQAISKLDSQNEIRNNWVIFAASLTQVLIGTWIVLYYFSGIDRQRALDFIQLNYPEYYSQFVSLDDFQLYLKNGITHWFISAAAMLAITFTSIIIFCTVKIFQLLRSLENQISDGHLKKHKTAVTSLLAQFITSPVAFLPPVASGFLLAFDFEHIQFISWILLAMTSCHGTINCLVMILTCPPYRMVLLDASSLVPSPSSIVRHAHCSTGSSSAQVELGSSQFYALCALGGSLACGVTHCAMTPLDIVKCRIQVNPAKYGGLVQGFKVTMAEDGLRGLGRGWAPTFIGYSAQGLGKYGFYEAFKNLYSSALGEENAYIWRTSVYLAASASAEIIADTMLAPMEAVKVRMQTSTTAPSTLRACAPMIYRTEGLSGFFKGLPPLWTRKIPYTMMKFTCFERIVELFYEFVVPKPREECSKAEQLIVTFTAGYIAGVFCAVVSHPPDVIVSKLNQNANSTIGSLVKELGFSGLWGGLGPRIIMVGTLTALQWFIYDSFKVAMNMPRPPPPQMPDSLRMKLAEATI